MSKQQFVDGVKEITIQSGIVRVDYFTYSASEKDGAGNPAKEHADRLVMSPEAFLQSFSAMERVVDQLIDRGAIKRKDDGAAKPAAGSPNF